MKKIRKSKKMKIESGIEAAKRNQSIDNLT